jgi:hypothetical protein
MKGASGRFKERFAAAANTEMSVAFSICNAKVTKVDGNGTRLSREKYINATQTSLYAKK